MAIRALSVRAVTILHMAFVPSLIADQGSYFDKKSYERHSPLPTFSHVRDQLPLPIYDEDRTYVECYWKAWELAFRNFHEPAPKSGFVSQFIDAAFNQNIFLWDTCFLTMFCNYAHPHVPGIRSLDNFYAKQHDTGEICREINRTTGEDFPPWVNSEGDPLFSRWGFDWEKGTRRVDIQYRDRDPPRPNPRLTLDALNHPILAWAEVESFRVTGDTRRLALVWEPLVRYHAALREYLRQGNGLYITDAASMDNSPRNRWLSGGGVAVDTSSEMVLFARNLEEIAGALGLKSEAEKYRKEAEALAGRINEFLWDSEKRFYFDRTLDGQRVPVKTIAGFWTLVSGVATPQQARALVAELENSRTFKTAHRVPTLSADEDAFGADTGLYWRGAVWAPTNVMVVRGLERYGFDDLAAEIARNHLACAVQVFRDTGTIWENYAPQKIRPGKPAKKDFVGWSGIAPIAFLIEYGIGVRVDAGSGHVTWTIRSPKRVGVERLWFGGRTVRLVCTSAGEGGKRTVRAHGDGAFRLTVKWRGATRTVEVVAGRELEFSL